MKFIIFQGAAVCAAAALLVVPRLHGQEALPRTLAGSVVSMGEPVAGVPITLHRVTPSGSGPVGSGVSNVQGEFRFALPPAANADSSSFEVFFATAEYNTVRYFGRPIHGGAVTENYTVAVFDTASSLPGAIRVSRRDIVLIPEPQGGWEANEVIQLNNAADRTLVSRDGMPTWEMRLPEGVSDFQAGEGEFAAAEVSLMDDRVLFLAALRPGDGDPLFLRYRVPLELEDALFAIDTPTDTLNVFVGQPSTAVEVNGLSTTRVVEVQGERFVQYGSEALADGHEVTLSWNAPTGPPVPPEVAGGAAAVLVLLVGSWIAFRHRPAETPGSSAATG